MSKWLSIKFRSLFPTVFSDNLQLNWQPLPVYSGTTVSHHFGALIQLISKVWLCVTSRPSKLWQSKFMKHVPQLSSSAGVSSGETTQEHRIHILFQPFLKCAQTYKVSPPPPRGLHTQTPFGASQTLHAVPSWHTYITDKEYMTHTVENLFIVLLEKKNTALTATDLNNCLLIRFAVGSILMLTWTVL